MRAQSSNRAHEWRPFTVDSYQTTYYLVAHLAGAYHIEGDSVIVRLDSGRIGSQITEGLGAKGVIRDLFLRAGIGESDTAGWRVDTLSVEVPVALSLDPQHETAVGPHHFAVRRPRGDLAGRWLFFQVGATQDGLFGLPAGKAFVNYACVGENLLGPTDASRQRSAQMRVDYARAC